MAEPLVIDPERAAWVPGRRKFFLMGLAFALAPSLPKPPDYGWATASLKKGDIFTFSGVRTAGSLTQWVVTADAISTDDMTTLMIAPRWETGRWQL